MECNRFHDRDAALARVIIGFLLLAIGAVLLLTWTDWEDAAIVPDRARTGSTSMILSP